MSTSIVNGRVNADTLNQANRVLEAFGTTASSVIRNLMEHIARTGSIPACALEDAQAVPAENIQAVTRFFESQPMPGRAEGVSDEEILSQERMARFGY